MRNAEGTIKLGSILIKNSRSCGAAGARPCSTVRYATSRFSPLLCFCCQDRSLGHVGMARERRLDLARVRSGSRGSGVP